jgi:hypothetical protein
VLDAVADADGDDELVWVPLRGPVALGLADDDAEDVPDERPRQRGSGARVPRGRWGRARRGLLADGVAVDDDVHSARTTSWRPWRCCWA